MASPALDADVEGFRMPAEWEPHEATWLGWSHNVSDWPGRFAGSAVGLATDLHGSHMEHDILVGCAVGIALGGLSGLRFVLWPPGWLPGA